MSTIGKAAKRAATQDAAKSRLAEWEPLTHQLTVDSKLKHGFGKPVAAPLQAGGGSVVYTRPVARRGNVSQLAYYSPFFARDESAPTRLVCRLTKPKQVGKSVEMVMCDAEVKQASIDTNVFSNAMAHLAKNHQEYLALEDLATWNLHPHLHNVEAPAAEVGYNLSACRVRKISHIQPATCRRPYVLHTGVQPVRAVQECQAHRHRLPGGDGALRHYDGHRALDGGRGAVACLHGLGLCSHFRCVR